MIDDTSAASPPTTRLASRDRLTLVVASLLLAVILGDIQASGFSPLVTTMMVDLNMSPTDVGWVLNGFTLIGAVVAGVLSRAGDTYGQRRVLIPIMALGVIGAITCALAESYVPMLVGRLLLGFGMPAVPLIWGLIRPRATAIQVQRISFWLASMAFGAIAAAAMLGGILISSGLPWQTIFWISAAGYGLMIVFLILGPPDVPRARDKVKLDLLGGLGLGAWLLALLMGLAWGADYGYTSTRCLVAFVVSVLLLVAWVIQQVRTPHRLMAFHRSDARQMVSGFSGAWAVYLSTSFVFLFIPLTLQAPSDMDNGFGLGVLGSTAPLLMLIPAAVIAQLASGRLITAVGARVVMSAGGVVVVIAFLGLAFFRSSYALFFVWMFIYGVGLLIVFHTSMALTASSSRHDNVSIVVGIQYAGGSLVTSLATAFVVGLMSVGPPGSVDSSEITVGYVVGGSLIALFAVVWLILVPRRHVDLYAAPEIAAS